MQIISYYFGVNGKPRFLSMSLYMKLHTVVKSTVLLSYFFVKKYLLVGASGMLWAVQ